MTTAEDVMRTEMERLTQYNRNLLAALNEARSQGTRSEAGSDGQADRPCGYGVFLGRFADGTVDVFTGGQRLRTQVANDVRPEALRRGETVVLDATMAVTQAIGYAATGTAMTLREVLPDRRRAVVGSAMEQDQVVFLSDALHDGLLRPGDILLVDGAARYAVELLPDSLADRPFSPPPKISLDQVAGLAEQIAQLRKLIETPLRHREQGVGPAPAVLLHGPPGCGKSMLAAAAAGSFADPGHAWRLHATHLLSKYVGETEQRLRHCFDWIREMARSGSPTVLIIEDVDAILRTRTVEARDSVGSAIVPHFLALLDDLTQLPNVAVIGTTNREDLIDPAAVRPGRFGARVPVGRPDEQAARDLLTLALPDAAEGLIDATVGFLYGEQPHTTLFEVCFADGGTAPVSFASVASGASLIELVRRAKSAPVYDPLTHGHPATLTSRHLRTAAMAELRAIQHFDQLIGATDWAMITGYGARRVDHVRAVSSGRQLAVNTPPQHQLGSHSESLGPPR